jgi:hypothetical protein
VVAVVFDTGVLVVEETDVDDEAEVVEVSVVSEAVESCDNFVRLAGEAFSRGGSLALLVFGVVRLEALAWLWDE